MKNRLNRYNDNNKNLVVKKDRILFIEDNEDASNFVKHVLEKNGYEVVCKNKASWGIECFLNSDFQLILIDFMLPDANGLDILKTIRKVKSKEELPVIMLTAHHSKDIIKEAAKEDISDFILKPIRASDLTSRIGKFLIKIKNEEISDILLSLNIPDFSIMELKYREYLIANDLATYPFRIGNMHCCAVLHKNADTHFLASRSLETKAESIILLVKGPLNWSLFWPRDKSSKIPFFMKKLS